MKQKISDYLQTKKGWTENRIKHFWHWTGIITLLAVSTFVVGQNALYLKTSILNLPKHAPFNGTSLPIKVVPDWNKLNQIERKTTFDGIPAEKFISIPSYNPTELKIPFSGLKYGNTEHDKVRNSKITYSVPYMGNYKLDGKENAGGHLAVDIKVPTGTPIYSIGNGIVTKVSRISTGFGKHIVVKHENFPSLENKEIKETYYSGYAHLSEILVREGDILIKGEKIGLSGATGTGTTPHLHFQIDNSNAPWHIFWHFTYKEAAKKGWSFSDAVNNGLGKEVAMANTINPMKYVQKYLNETTIENNEPNAPNSIKTETTNLPIKEVEVKTEPIVKETPIKEEVQVKEAPIKKAEEIEKEVIQILEPIVPTIEKKDVKKEAPKKEEEKAQEFIKLEDEVFSINFYAEKFYLTGTEFNVLIKVIDKSLKPLKNKENLEGLINLDVTNQEAVFINKKTIKVSDLGKEKIYVYLEPKFRGKFKIKATIGDKEFISPEINIIERPEVASKIQVSHDGRFNKGVAEKIRFNLVDQNGNPTATTPLGVLKIKLVEGKGIFKPSRLEVKDFNEGEAEISFISNSDEDVIIEASIGLAKGTSSTLRSSLNQDKAFEDVTPIHDNFEAIKYLKEKEVISGYKDNTFKPANSVSRAEALKIILEGTGKEIKTADKIKFKDIGATDWYVDYIATALENKIVAGYPDQSFKPNKKVNRVEFFKILLKSMEIEADPLVKENPYQDVDKLEWYAPYANYVKEKNLLDSEENFSPSKEMSRAEVAEAIYRLMKIREEGVETFKK